MDPLQSCCLGIYDEQRTLMRSGATSHHPSVVVASRLVVFPRVCVEKRRAKKIHTNDWPLVPSIDVRPSVLQRSVT